MQRGLVVAVKAQGHESGKTAVMGRKIYEI